MKQIFLGIGSNLRNPIKNVSRALKELEQLKGIFEFRQSFLYQTSPVSHIPQGDYINAVCLFKTDKPIHALFKEFQKIEKGIGKEPKSKESPRMIDIDILLYGDSFLETKELIIPHQKMLERLFVLQPMSDLVQEIDFPYDVNKTQKIALISLIEKLSKERSDSVHRVCFEPL